MKIILFAIVFCALFSVGCIDDNMLAGNTYEGPDGDVITFFKDDNMHYMNSDGDGSLGTYIIENGHVYFNAVFWTWSAKINNEDELIDGDGDVYTKVNP